MVVCSTASRTFAGGGVFRATAFLKFLFYSAVLFTEGIGVYLQKNGGPNFMVFATGALIPLELRHIFHRVRALALALFSPLTVSLSGFFIGYWKREPAQAPTCAPRSCG